MRRHDQRLLRCDVVVAGVFDRLAQEAVPPLH
jgi:hypothetical protein